MQNDHGPCNFARHKSLPQVWRYMFDRPSGWGKCLRRNGWPKLYLFTEWISDNRIQLRKIKYYFVPVKHNTISHTKGTKTKVKRRPYINLSPPPPSAGYICWWNRVSIGSDDGLSPDRLPNYYLNKYWKIVNWTIGNKIQWSSNRNKKTFHLWKCVWNCRLRNSGRFAQGQMCVKLTNDNSYLILVGERTVSHMLRKINHEPIPC